MFYSVLFVQHYTKCYQIMITLQKMQHNDAYVCIIWKRCKYQLGSTPRAPTSAKTTEYTEYHPDLSFLQCNKSFLWSSYMQIKFRKICSFFLH